MYDLIKVSRLYRLLTMVYSVQNYWVFRLFHRPLFLGVETTTFRKLNVSPSAGEVGRKTLTQLGPLKRASLSAQ
jgi:hypothetical protein